MRMVLAIMWMVLLPAPWLWGQESGAKDEQAAAAKEAPAEAEAAPKDEPLPPDYSCLFCHGDASIMQGPQANLLVTEDHLKDDIHWAKGLRCHDCHGGSPTLTSFTDHRNDESFRSVKTPADIPTFCGHCHSDLEYMRRFNPSARTDQEREYWTSGHGKKLKSLEDPSQAKVATCVDCHDHHGIRAVKDQQAPIYPTRVADTCGKCHSNPEVMDGLTYGDRPLGHTQVDDWRSSVHAEALYEKGDLSAPTCNDCHGNHGALPPGVDSVANACGTCHGKIGSLFAETRMRHKFEEVGLPGCATCHGNHRITHPSDDMLGMSETSVCRKCHEQENLNHGATIAGAEAALAIRNGLDQLKREIEESQRMLDEAARLGMPVRKPRFQLREATDALTNARSLIHSFSTAQVQEAVDKGLAVTKQVKEAARAAMAEHTNRRIWLAASLLPILLVVLLLIMYIRARGEPYVAPQQ